MTGIFEMATGTGKTFTALACLQHYSNQIINSIAIISCPYSHLLQQWEKEIIKFGFELPMITADSTNPKWKNVLADQLIDIHLGNQKDIIILTTHTSLSSKDFKKIISNFKSESNIPIFIIIDEVHGIGAEKNKQGLLDVYQYRLGLSATPKRWFDIEGTEAIYDYFNGEVFHFSLNRAINEINPRTNKTYLTPYYYKPFFISLNDEEIERYQSLTMSIVRKYSRSNDEEKKQQIENLMFLRADIVKEADAKYDALECILDNLTDKVNLTLIYCSPGQINRVMRILNNRNIMASTFTMNEGTKPMEKYSGQSERQFLLSRFEVKDYQILVAIRCLDEGIDVPPARIGIIMASTGNPREYIQRIGRVIRRHPGKEHANIYDLIVKPTEKIKEYRDIEKAIFKKEMIRYKEISKIALNKMEAMMELERIQENCG